MRNHQGTEEQSLPQAECSHVPLNPTHPPTHTLARSCLCDWKVIAEALGPRKKGLASKTICKDPSPTLRVHDRFVPATEEKADPTRNRLYPHPHQGL